MAFQVANQLMQFLIARAPQVKADLRVILKRLDEGLGMDVEGVEVRVWGACERVAAVLMVTSMLCTSVY